MTHMELYEPDLLPQTEEMVRKMADREECVPLRLSEILSILPLLGELPEELLARIENRGNLSVYQNAGRFENRGEEIAGIVRDPGGRNLHLILPGKIGGRYESAAETLALWFEKDEEIAGGNACQPVVLLVDKDLRIEWRNLFADLKRKKLHLRFQLVWVREMPIDVEILLYPQDTVTRLELPTPLPLREEITSGMGLMPLILEKAQETLQTKIGIDRICADSGDLSGSFYITLSRLDIRHTVASDPSWDQELEGFLELTFAGKNNLQSTLLGWRKQKSQASLTEYPNPLLLFYGEDSRLLSISSQMIESDQKSTDLLQKIIGIFKHLAASAGWLPGLGAGVRAGSALTTGLLRCLAATVRDDHEYSYYGSLGSEEFRPGAYRLWKGQSQSDYDIAVDFYVHPWNPKPCPSDTQVAILIEELDLTRLERLTGLKDRDIVHIECLCGPEGSNNAKRQRLEWKQPYGMNRQTVGYRTAFHNALVYRGPYAKGIPIQFNLTVSAEDLSKEVAQILQEASGLAAALVPKEEERLEGIADLASDLYTAIAMMKKKIRFSTVFKSILLHGDGAPDDGSVLVADLSGGGWTKLSIPLDSQIPLDLKLKIGRI